MKPLRKAVLHFRRSVLLLGLALVVGVSLGAADLLLTPRILANREAETTARVPTLVPGATHSQRRNLPSGPVHAALDAGDSLRGWVFPVQGHGFAGPIELLLGLNPDLSQVTGVHILAQSETPGLGSRITQPAWLARFAAPTADGRYRLGRDIDGLSGATISSAAVVDAVNRHLDQLPDPETLR